MRIWLVQRAEPTPHDNSGAQRLMRMGILSKLLDSFGHEVIWWTSDFDHYNANHRNGANCRKPIWRQSSIQYIKSIGYSKTFSIRRFLDNSLLAKKFSELIRKEKILPDIILASIPTSQLAKEAVKFGNERDIPVVLDIRDLWPDVIYDLVPFFLRPLVKILFIPYSKAMTWAAKNATAIVGLTKPFVNWGLAWANRKPSQFDQDFPMGYIQKSLTKKEILEAKAYWDYKKIFDKQKSLNVVFFGRIGPYLDLNIVLEAAKILQKKKIIVKFIICGIGSELSTLKFKAKNLTNVIFTGWITQSYIQVLMQRSHLGLVPYVKIKNFYKNITNKPAEYLSGDLPIALSLEKGELYDLIKKNKCGFSYHNDPQKLCDKLIKMSTDYFYRKEISKNATKTYKKKFNGQLTYGKMIKYLVNLVKFYKKNKY